uniref:Solute carrier family 22 member 13b n=1 Tax=Myripristis murdjan TaxID=586833 RepID=A0A667YYR9_9TELE
GIIVDQEVLQEIEEFGLFQKRLLLTLCIPNIFVAFDVIGQVCFMFTPVDLDLETIESYGINSTTKCVDGWDYETPEGASSTVTEVGCDEDALYYTAAQRNSHYVDGNVRTLFFFRCRFGRRFVVLLSILLLLLFGVGAAFSPNVYVYMVIRFVGGTAVSGAEWTDSSRVAVFTFVTITFFPVGLMILSGVAYLIRNWRILQLSNTQTLLLSFVSARWLMTQGKKEELQKQIQRAARVNRRKVPEALLEKLEVESESNKGSMVDIFRISYLRNRALIMSCVWFGASVVYFGLSLNVGSFGLDMYLTQFIFAITEVFAHLVNLALSQHFGRRKCQTGFLLAGGCACLVIPAIPKHLPVVVTVIAILGKFAATASFSMVYSAELYPTVLRQNSIGFNSICGRVGSILAPLIRLLGVYHHSIPMVLYGIVPLAAGGLCLFLPETFNPSAVQSRSAGTIKTF